MQNKLNRRGFFKLLGISACAGSGFLNAQINTQSKISSVIDLGLCDGCKDYENAMCVSACRDKNKERFPNPIENIPDYFPRKGYEDHSKNKNDTSYLSPYNWTYVQKLTIDGKEVFIPRRCMHCDDPTCQKVCPFGVISKDESGAVKIDSNGCFGGAKCKDMCPWHIPQRQAGVGLYLKIAPKLAGGGVMYKCDGCADLLANHKAPACAKACPKNAILFMDRDLAYKYARQKAKKYQGSSKETFIYGDTQNGGTSTLYVSPVSFEKIQNAIKEQNSKKNIHMNLEVKNKLNEDSSLIKGVLFTPIVGAITGGVILSKLKDRK